MIKGCFTALVTPFTGDGRVDEAGLARLIDFQIESGVTGILAVGTTGESPTLSWEEHNQVIESVAQAAKGKCVCIAGTGSNNTSEALAATKHAADLGADAVLLVDPYYNGPSSMEIRKEYIEPVAKEFPKIDIIPYVIPGRTGTQLMPEDLAILNRDYKNVKTVKEATGDAQNMRRTRECCGKDFTILSGDDNKTFEMMTDPDIGAAGVISVMSNIAPAAVKKMVEGMNDGDREGAEKISRALSPLFNLVTVNTVEKTTFGEVIFRARNPLPVKALMNILGMPAGPCRQPMGKLTKNGLDKVLWAAREVWQKNPEILEPVAGSFGVDIEARLEDPQYRKDLFYEE